MFSCLVAASYQARFLKWRGVWVFHNYVPFYYSFFFFSPSRPPSLLSNDDHCPCPFLSHTEVMWYFSSVNENALGLCVCTCVWCVWVFKLLAIFNLLFPESSILVSLLCNFVDLNPVGVFSFNQPYHIIACSMFLNSPV